MSGYVIHLPDGNKRFVFLVAGRVYCAVGEPAIEQQTLQFKDVDVDSIEAAVVDFLFLHSSDEVGGLYQQPLYNPNAQNDALLNYLQRKNFDNSEQQTDVIGKTRDFLSLVENEDVLTIKDKKWLCSRLVFKPMPAQQLARFLQLLEREVEDKPSQVKLWIPRVYNAVIWLGLALLSIVIGYFVNPKFLDRLLSPAIAITFNVVAYNEQQQQFYTNSAIEKPLQKLPNGTTRYYFSFGPEKSNAHIYVVQRDNKGKVNMIFPRLTPDIASRFQIDSWTGSVVGGQTVRFPKQSEIILSPDTQAECFYVFAFYEANQALDAFTQTMVSGDKPTDGWLNRQFSQLLENKRAVKPYATKLSFTTDLSAPKTYNPQTNKIEMPQWRDINKTKVDLCVDCYYKIKIDRVSNGEADSPDC